MISILDTVLGTWLGSFFSALSGWFIAPNVSLLSFVIAISLLCIVIGSILMRV